MNDWPDQPITFAEAVEQVYDRLLDASDRPPQELDSSLSYPAPKNRLLVRKARELLFQAFSEGRLTLWARTFAQCLKVDRLNRWFHRFRYRQVKMAICAQDIGKE